MTKSRQTFIELARKKMEDGLLPKEQRELILQMLDLMIELADDGGTATSSAKLLENATHHYNLLAIIQQQAAELDALKRIAFNLTSNLQLQGVLDTVVTEAMRLINDAQDSYIFLYQDDQLSFGAALDSKGERNQLFAMPRPDGLTYSVARSRETMVIDDMHNHPMFAKMPREEINGSIAGIPLMMGETVVGVMNMSRRKQGGFTGTEMRLLSLLADQAAVAVINARLHQAVSAQALSDTLTGLPNRRALDARIDNEVKRSIRYGRPFAVLMMDLDGFKSINDTWGHLFGDQVLFELAQFLSSNLRSTDFLARYGGDELTMIFPETDILNANQVGEKIHNSLRDFEITQPDGNRRHLGVSGGIALYPRHGRTASDLLRAADEALYRAKKHSRNSFLLAREMTGELQIPKNFK